MRDQEQGVASVASDRPQPEADVNATPSGVSGHDLLRMLVNVTTALSACCDDTLRSILAPKIVATHRAAVELIERAKAPDNDGLRLRARRLRMIRTEHESVLRKVDRSKRDEAWKALARKVHQDDIDALSAAIQLMEACS